MTHTEVEQRAIAEALKSDGFDPTQVFEGAQWRDTQVTWLPDGHAHIVTLTSIGKTVSGWQARVVRREVNGAGVEVPSGCGRGFIYVDRLVKEYEWVAS